MIFFYQFYYEAMKFFKSNEKSLNTENLQQSSANGKHLLLILLLTSSINLKLNKMNNKQNGEIQSGIDGYRFLFELGVKYGEAEESAFIREGIILLFRLTGVSSKTHKAELSLHRLSIEDLEIYHTGICWLNSGVYHMYMHRKSSGVCVCVCVWCEWCVCVCVV